MIEREESDVDQRRPAPQALHGEQVAAEIELFDDLVIDPVKHEVGDKCHLRRSGAVVVDMAERKGRTDGLCSQPKSRSMSRDSITILTPKPANAARISAGTSQNQSRARSRRR